MGATQVDVRDFLPTPREWSAVAAREGLSAREALSARIAASKLLGALLAHCSELAAEETGAAAAAEREAAEALAARRARAASAPTLEIVSTPVAVSVAPAGDALHAANLRHSAGWAPTRFRRSPDGRVVQVQRGDTARAGRSAF